jgi:hypothetical protein
VFATRVESHRRLVAAHPKEPGRSWNVANRVLRSRRRRSASEHHCVGFVSVRAFSAGAGLRHFAVLVKAIAEVGLAATVRGSRARSPVGIGTRRI